MSTSDILPSYPYLFGDIISEDAPESELPLFELIKKNDFNAFAEYLEEHPGLAGHLHEVRNKYGHNLLVCAIKSRKVKMTTLVVHLDNDLFSLGNALLLAVQKGYYEVMMMILSKLRILKKLNNLDDDEAVLPCKTHKGLWKSTCEDFPPYATPLLLACEANNFLSIKILLKCGHRLHAPHPRLCQCTVCRAKKSRTLTEALARHRQHKALTCPAYILLTSVDPLLEAFRLKQDLYEESTFEHEFAEEYMAMSDDCANFATDMLQLCKTREEVMVLLTRKSEFKNLVPRPFNRVGQALQIGCAEFVAHSNCQQVLSSEWYKNNEWMKHASHFHIGLVFILRTIFMPFLMAVVIIAPFSPLARRQRSPSNRYMNDVSSFVYFLLITFAVSYTTSHQINRGPPETPWLYVLILYITGIWIDKVCLVYKRGREAFLVNPWNTYDVMMVTFYTLTFVTWALSAREVRLDPDSAEVPREYWPFYEPRLVAESLYTIALLLTFMKVFMFMQMTKDVGSLQLCIFQTLLYMIPFFVILTVVWVAFAVALFVLYNYYSSIKAQGEEPDEDETSDAFMSLLHSFHSIYWLFLDVEEEGTGHVSLPPIYMKLGDQEVVLRHRHDITQGTGLTLLGFFQLAVTLGLLEMLHGIMYDTYDEIAAKDVQVFKVSRTKVWMGYFYPDHPLPVPFNLIPKPIALYKAFQRAINISPVNMFKREPQRAPSKADDEIYQRLMVNLTRRYFKENYKSQLADEDMVDDWDEI